MDTTARCLAATVAGLVVFGANVPRAGATDGPPFVWADSTASDCPFPRSTRIDSKVQFTGRYFVVPGTGADTWYPAWASDGSLYSTFADGTTNGVTVQGYSSPDSQSTGNARIDGNDPSTLTVTALNPTANNPTPYAGRYPSASLVYNGVWYYGTYTLDDLSGACHNWCTQGPFVGFRRSSDGGKTWTDGTHTPSNPLFGESGKNGGKVKFGPVHMVDFGKNLEHSPDGRAYFVSGGAYGANGLANWIGGDAVYLGRVQPTPANMDDTNAFEFYDGSGWSHGVANAKPLLLWQGRLGSVTITYDAPAKAYLMFVSRPHYQNNNTGPFDTLLLESDAITGPFHIVATWDSFGPQAYFVNVPSKFISADGKTMWLLYSANFASQGSDPAGSGYNMGLHEFTLTIGPSTGPGDASADATAPSTGGTGNGTGGRSTGGSSTGTGSGGGHGTGGSGANTAAGGSSNGGQSDLDASAETAPAQSSSCSCRIDATSDEDRAGFVLPLLAAGAAACLRRKRVSQRSHRLSGSSVSRRISQRES